MINITIEVSETSTVTLKTDDFNLAMNFIDQYAVEDSRIYFHTIYDKETAFHILYNWKKELDAQDIK